MPSACSRLRRQRHLTESARGAQQRSRRPAPRCPEQSSPNETWRVPIDDQDLAPGHISVGGGDREPVRGCAEKCRQMPLCACANALETS